MKKLYFILSVVLASALTACSSRYLDQEPGGSTITEHQYQQMDNVLEGTVKGIYPNLYAYGGEHDVFGQRSIDMYGDLLCGDMALNSQKYGWFATDELMQTYGRKSYYWNYYYFIIRSCNKAMNAVEATGGIPSLKDSVIAKMTNDQLKNGNYYAQVLTLRGWAYAGLLRTFASHEYNENELAFPIYTEMDTEADTILGAPRARCGEVFDRIKSDLTGAVRYFDAYKAVERTNKLEVNISVAQITLAYAYLNCGMDSAALNMAKSAIESRGDARIMTSDEVLTSGFNNVNNKSWVWGQDVTVETTTSLASWFGQCDIYSYSYASAGDIKGIDDKLYNEVKSRGWDKREYWWGKLTRNGGKSSYQFAPDGKFFSATSTELEGDRDWLSDNVFMRIETAYLIAAEAACRLGLYSEAKHYLCEITKERIKDDAEGSTVNADRYEAWKNALTDAKLLDEIRYNWRIELWGEGYGLQTFRRFNRSVNLGTNHLRSQKTISPTSPSPRYFTFELPNSEFYYNPYIRDVETADVQVRRQK